MLKLENISYEIQEEKGQKGIIHHVDLTINDNEFVVITGPNGGGKSTLAKLIAGIINPTGGAESYICHVEDVNGRPDDEEKEPTWESASRFSSRCGLKVFRFSI